MDTQPIEKTLQDFDSPEDYLQYLAQESTDKEKMCLAGERLIIKSLKDGLFKEGFCMGEDEAIVHYMTLANAIKMFSNESVDFPFEDLDEDGRLHVYTFQNIFLDTLKSMHEGRLLTVKEEVPEIIAVAKSFFEKRMCSKDERILLIRFMVHWVKCINERLGLPR